MMVYYYFSSVRGRMWSCSPSFEGVLGAFLVTLGSELASCAWFQFLKPSKQHSSQQDAHASQLSVILALRRCLLRPLLEKLGRRLVLAHTRAREHTHTDLAFPACVPSLTTSGCMRRSSRSVLFSMLTVACC